MIINLKDNDMSISEALFIAKPFDTIILGSKTYHEKIRVSIPNLTMIGGENSCISWDDYHGKTIPASLGGDGVNVYGTSTSATFTVLQEAINFKAEGIKFENTHILPDNTRMQAVAFKSETSNIIIKNCEFISKQDTLYVDYGFNNKFINCYAEGDIDFIFGSADCEFIDCKFKAINLKGHAYFTAPDTFIINDNGFVFRNCLFYAEEEFDVFLGRAWFPLDAIQDIFPKMKLIDCQIKGSIKPYLIKMKDYAPKYISLEIINTDFNGEIINEKYNSVV